MEEGLVTKRGPGIGPPYPLAMASSGETVKLISIRAGWRLRERLLSLGLAINDVVLVEQHQGRGIIVVSKNGQKYGLGGGIAQKILVKKEG